MGNCYNSVVTGDFHSLDLTNFCSGVSFYGREVKELVQVDNIGLEQARKFVEGVIQIGKPWTDPEFPPEMSSLFDPDHDEGKIITYKTITWKRVGEIFKHPAIFCGVSPNDIKQGMLGDCYFLSALSSLAEYPENIMERFETK